MEILRGRPEIAAVDLLRVPSDVKERVQALEAQRLETLANALVEHMDLVTQISELNAEGRRDEARELLETFRDRVEPERERDVLFAEIEDLVGPENVPELRRIVDEYWDSLIDRRLIGSGADPETAPERRRTRIQASLERGLFEREIRRAYDQSLKTTRDALEGIYAAVEPTDDQRDTIRAIVLEDFQRTGIAARTGADRRATMRRVYDALDEDRRGRLFDYAMRIVVPEG
ncbi:MAG: hypothetical protein AAF297_11295 [Planctomycetota bacterium]